MGGEGQGRGRGKQQILGGAWRNLRGLGCLPVAEASALGTCSLAGHCRPGGG